MGKGQNLYQKAKKIIPGGTQLLSKRPEMFLPDLWPSYYSKSSGCKVWDLDNRLYTDMSFMGIGACVLGYSDPDVNKAVHDAVERGNMNTLNAPEEVDLAELLIELHPWAEMARFARGGGDAMTVAVRISRAATGRDKILFCGYHGWHDWYLSANLADDKALDGHLLKGLQPSGVPRALKGTALPFHYNNTEEFLKLVGDHDGQIAAVVMEPIRNDPPQPEFMNTIRRITREKNIVLIFDEITAGFRLSCGGSHLTLGTDPDIAVFGKAMSNGFAMGAIIGRRAVMEAAQSSFISSTYWTDRIGPAASLATIRKFRRRHVHKHLDLMGRKIQNGWKSAAQNNGLDIHISGIAPLGHFDFQREKHLVLKTLFTQLMLEKGFLATNAFYASFAHRDSDVRRYLRAVDQAFGLIASAVKSGNPEPSLKGPVCHSGFSRLN